MRSPGLIPTRNTLPQKQANANVDLVLIPLPYSRMLNSRTLKVAGTGLLDSLRRERLEVDAWSVCPDGLTTESRSGASRFAEEAAVTQEESLPVRPACEVEAMAAASGGVDRESSFRALVPLSIDVTDPDISVESSAADVTVCWRKAFEE